MVIKSRSTTIKVVRWKIKCSIDAHVCDRVALDDMTPGSEGDVEVGNEFDLAWGCRTGGCLDRMCAGGLVSLQTDGDVSLAPIALRNSGIGRSCRYIP
jgi:hypothetical protein